jgi:hypothetical protein
VRAPKRGRPLAQQTARQEGAHGIAAIRRRSKPPRSRRINEDKIDVAVQAPVLETVVEHDALHTLPFELATTLYAIRVLHVRHIGEQLCEQLALIIQRVPFATVAAGEDAGSACALTQLARDPLDHRRLARAAGGQISDADHRNLESLDRQESAVVQRTTRTNESREQSSRNSQELDDAAAARQPLIGALGRGRSRVQQRVTSRSRELLD